MFGIKMLFASRYAAYKWQGQKCLVQGFAYMVEALFSKAIVNIAFYTIRRFSDMANAILFVLERC